MKSPVFPILLIAMALPVLSQTASAESVDKMFSDFFRQQEKFEAEDRRRREEGYVLERFKDPAGRNAGTLSFGGGKEREPVYGAPTGYNFTGRNYDEPDSGILNLRLKF